MLKKRTLLFAFAFAAVTLQLSAQQVKGDPWIFQAYKELYSRQPTAWEVNINLYNQGRWNNYNELKQYVQNYQASLSGSSLSISTQKVDNNRTAVVFNQNGRSIAVDLITNDGGTIIAQGGGNVINAGGANLIASGGGNLKDLPGASLGSNRQLMAGDKKIIKTSGSGAIIIR